MASGCIFELKNISFNYSNAIVALDTINLSIRSGEMIGILGANGSGKSTLIKLLGGLAFPKTGIIKYKDTVLSEVALEEEEFRINFRKSVGILFQNPEVQLFTESVMEEIAFGPINLGVQRDEAEKIVEKILDDFNLTKIKERSPHSLSGGEKKRVALASILAVNPEVLLLDEPTSGLDPKNAGYVIDLIIELNSMGKTVISATNDMIAAPEISERVIVIGENHSILKEGSIEEIIGDEEVLVGANLIHSHKHRHDTSLHKHEHTHLKPGHHDKT